MIETLTETQKSPIATPEAIEGYTPEWVTYTPERQYGVAIKAPGIGRISGTLDIDPEASESSRSLYVDIFAAEQSGNGHGKELLRMLKAEGEKYNVDTMVGHFTSEPALGAFGSVMGKDAVTFRNRFSGEVADVSFEEAMKTPDRYISSARLSSLAEASATHDAEPIRAIGHVGIKATM